MDNIRELFNPDRRILAEAYNKKKKTNNRFAFLFKFLFWFLFLGFSLEKTSYNYLNNLNINYEFKLIVYFIGFYLLYGLFSLLTDYFLGYKIDRQYKLLNQDTREWFVDEIKSFILGVFFFYLAVRTYLYLLVKFPVTWWIYYAIIASIFIVLITFIFPTVLLPIFFKLESYPESELKKRLFQLVEKADLSIDDIYEINLSSKVNAANAAVMGIGSSRKIVLSDNLKDFYTSGEIEAVLAHELGHQVHGDLFKNLLMEPIIILITSYIIASLWPGFVLWFGYSSISSPATIPLLMIIVNLLSLLLSPFQLYISRKFEKRADLFAINLSTKVDSFTTALAKLADESLAPLRVSIYEKVFKSSHPPIKERLEYILRNR